MVETVQGPIRGYYLAAYACPVGEHGEKFVGYYKVFGVEPHGFFEQHACLLKGCPEQPVRDATAALELAIGSATRQVLSLPFADELPACRERRALYRWELQALGLAN